MNIHRKKDNNHNRELERTDSYIRFDLHLYTEEGGTNRGFTPPRQVSSLPSDVGQDPEKEISWTDVGEVFSPGLPSLCREQERSMRSSTSLTTLKDQEAIGV